MSLRKAACQNTPGYLNDITDRVILTGQTDRNSMRTVPSTELKAKLSAILGDVERGETVAITRHGRVIGRIVPAGEHDAAARRKAAVEWILENKRSGRRTGMTLQDILSARDEGRP